ncbi:MAG: response regulator transcription factor [Ruminococcaceae bacterium]|nr:response regulator transcription factor [Oscillospiraceae bacterium]
MIFLVEDDSSIRELMLYTLKVSGFEAKGFKDSLSFFEELNKELPRLIILDIMLPGMDGVEILKEIRKKSSTENIPVIMATAKGSEYDKVLCLDAGADDYLQKPFGMMEMISRIKAVLRRVEPKKKESILNAGLIALDTNSHKVSINKENVELTFKEYELLKLFMEHQNKAYTRDELLEIVWGVDFMGETRTVDVHIGTLRTKLKDAGAYIKTVRGVGYKMEV